MDISNKKRKGREDNGTIKKRKNNFEYFLELSIDTLFSPYITFLKNKKKYNWNKVRELKEELIQIIFKNENVKKWEDKYDIEFFCILKKYRKMIKKWFNKNKIIKDLYTNSSYCSEKCSICREKLNCNDIISIIFNEDSSILLNCNHSFHFNCLMKWHKNCNWASDNSWKKKLTCPLCRNYDPKFFCNKISFKHDDIYEIHSLK
jgi:hypothetical protein